MSRTNPAAQEAVTPATCQERLLRPDQVAARFNVSARTVTYWAWRGKLPSVRTLGGHYRFRPSDVDALVAEGIDKQAPEVVEAVQS